MALTNIALIDDLMVNKPGEIKAGSDPAAVAALQDLLRGHGFARMPGLLGEGRGSFGPRTRTAVMLFRKANGLSPGATVDAATLQQLVSVPAREPIASEAYIALVLDLTITKSTRLVSLVSRFGGGGDFKHAETLSDAGGLAAGFLPWTQAHGQLHDMLDSMNTVSPTLCQNYFGGEANLGLIINALNAPGFGLSASVGTLFNLNTGPWKSTFATAGTSLGLQAATSQRRSHDASEGVRRNRQQDAEAHFGACDCLRAGHGLAFRNRPGNGLLQRRRSGNERDVNNPGGHARQRR